MYSPELQSKVAVWRQRAVEGTLTREEMREAIALLRQGRVGAAIASETSRKKSAKAAIPTATDLLAELDGL